MMTREREHGIILDVQDNPPVGFPKAWTITGYLLLAGAVLFVGRIVYEETILTWNNGPQMIGFAMMHGAVPLFLIAGLVGLPGSLFWMIVSLVLLSRKKFRIPLVDWVPMALIVIFAALLFIPYGTWEELVVHFAGPGSHGSDFMVQAAASGNQRLVTHFLREGYDVNYEDDGGTTSLSGAAVGGNKEMVGFLLSKGADVNRKSRLNDETPLMAASAMGKPETVNMLLDNGADPCAVDREGHNAAGLAKKYGHADIAQYLSSRFTCQEKVADSCVDSAFSACVHP
jgi:hypothetical protein